MLIQQSGRCAVCGEPLIGPREPVVDHDHKTGIVRGLLHGSCNSGIGLLKENPIILERAADYLRQFAPTAPPTFSVQPQNAGV
jgi:hypothetical protein